jgi:hypothetical protein
MSLIKQIHRAIQAGELREPITTADVKKWVKTYGIVKDDGEEYAESSINAILSNSDLKNRPTTNLNPKMLQSAKNDNGAKEYWYDDEN